MSEDGELSKRAKSVKKINDLLLDTKKYPLVTDWSNSQWVSMCDVDSAKKDFWNYFNIAPDLDDYFEEDGKEVTDAYVEAGKKLCEYWFGDSE